MSKSTPAQYVLILIDLAVSRGVALDELLENTSLEAGTLHQMGTRVAEEDFRTLSFNALELTEEPALGLRLGEQLNLSAHAVLGQAFLTCRTLGEVLELFERYYRVLAQDLDLQFMRSEEAICIRFDPLDFGPEGRFGVESIAAALKNTLQALLDDDSIEIAYEFPYCEPEYGRVYREVLGEKLEFGRRHAAMTLSSQYMHRHLPSSHPALRTLYEAECERLLADLEDSIEIAAQTRRLLRKFEGHYPQMPQIAALLHLSSRTYRRRLADENTSYQEILDDVRAEHATQYLQENELSIAAIAQRLGFSDPSNFRRAYFRWTGQAPGSVRRESNLR
ncbi:MAG: AraC family transcriptional regulator ligand-binding domain-containing protein [Pseudomonadota bacterium]